jgi:putative nucleotidyltransferase with HDIG domain
MMKVNSFVRIVAFLALSAAAALWMIAPPTEGSFSTVAMLALLALTADLMGFLLPRGAAGSISFIPYMTAVMLVPNVSALAAIVSTRVIVELARRRGGLKFVFNTAQLLLTYAIAVAVYRGFGGRSLYDFRHMSVAELTIAIGLPMIAAYVATFTLNSFLVSHIVALTTGGKTLRVWRENNASTLGIDVLATPLVFLFAWMFANYGPMMASLLWIPILGVRQLNTTNLELAQTNRELLELMVKSIEARDPYTSGHSRRVKEYALKIARLMGLTASEVEKIGTAALLHDVGKIYDKYAPILSKEDRLSPEEWAIIKEHPLDGANLIATMTRLRELVPAVKHHHENWDGSGYPEGLKGEDIPLASRVIMLADTFDAMTTNRPYRGPLGEEDVRAELIRCRGRQFDPEITDRLLASDFWRTLFPPVDRVLHTPRLMQLLSADSKK